MLQLLLFGCIVFPLIAAVAVALDKEGTLRRRIVYAGTGITALSALGLALYGSFVLPISPDSSLQPLMTVLDLALLVFILYVAVNIRHRLSMGLALGQLAGMIYLDFFMLEGHQATAFLADPLALVMVLVISLVGGIVCIFGLGYMQEHEDHLRLAKSKQSRFFFFLLLFLGAMNGLVLCDSLTWVFFFWEITTLCSFFLISHDGTREAKRNATRALWMNMVGGIGFLAAMLFMQKAIGTLSIQAMLAQSVVMHSTAAMLPIAFLCFAAFTKSAQLPFQSWLCGAMVAPTPVSALLHSSTMVKAGVYLVLRLSPAFAGTMLAGIVSLTGAFKKMLSGLSEGYQEYVKSHPEADYSNLGNQIAEYLTSDQAKGIIQKYLKDILKNNGEVTITPEQIKELLTSVMSDFQSWLVEQNANPGAEEFGTYFQQYLQTGRANAIVNKWANEIFGNIDFNISSDTLQAMAKELADGYTAYAKEKNYADPTKMAENFVNYIKTDDGKRRLNQGLSEAINMDSLQKQISTAMSSYMGQAMSAYTGAISQAISTQMTSAMSQVTTQLAGGLEAVMTSAMSRIGENLQKALGGSMNFNADAFANAFRFNMTEDDLTELMMSMSGTQSASYDNNLQQLGYADFSHPSSISIYPKDFDNKEKVVEVLDHYNQQMEDEGKEEQVISYTDIVGTMMSSVTTIINTISYVLIAFVAISLLVSSIMIGVITYISVLERKKEIGILRAIGASKGNISQVFNAETFIIGLCAGLIGIGLTLLILIPGNMLIHALADNDRVSAILPIAPAIVLILLSVVLTLLGGLIPSRKAAKSDPVTALRTE